MKKILLFLACLLGLQATAQEKMRITMNDGTQMDFNVRFIDEMTFYTPQPFNIVGEWVSYSDQMSGTIQCLEFKEDGTMVYKTFYTKYQMSNESTGTYSLNNKTIELSIYGSIVNISIDNYTENDFFSNANGNFYRVREPLYDMNTTDEPITIGNDGDIIKYVDNCFVGLENNKIKPLKEGKGYALVEDAESADLKAYSIGVHYGDESPRDFTQYFKQTIGQIESVFGEVHQTNNESHRITYTKFSSSIYYVAFSFSDDMEKNPASEVISVSLYFYDAEKMQPYSEHIANTYTLDSGASTDSRKTYYDSSNAETASVKITVSSTTNVITYTDLKQTPVSVVDWTQYFKKSGDQIKAEFGNNPSITDDDEDEDYSYLYSKNIGELKRLSFYFTKGFEKVISIRVTFNDASSMQDYCDTVDSKYKLYSDGGTTKTYYDTDAPSTASTRILINTSRYYISYYDLSE